MSTESVNAVAGTALSRRPAPKRRMWFFVLLVLLIVISFSYLSHMDSRENFVNKDFYRVLYETSNKLNENLSQLRKMHVNEESPNSIRTQLPSYKQTTQLQGSTNNTKILKFHLVGKKIEIRYEDEDFNAEVQITDILPTPKRGFSQYLFANNKGKVLAAVGDEKTLSIDTLKSIGKEIEKNKRRYQFNFKTTTGGSDGNDEWNLPSYSSHVDMKLSHEEFRIFIFPFSLDTPLIKNDSTSTINTLYLVGLLPKHKLHTEGSGYRDLPLLLVTLVSLLFVWFLLRLYLLPKNQSIGSWYRKFIIISSYGFLIVLIALVLALMQKTALQANKDNAAALYGQEFSKQLNADLIEVFNDLADYKPFYHKLIDGLNELRPVNTNCSDNLDAQECKEPASKEFSNIIKKSLTSLVTPNECPLDFERILPGYAFTHTEAYPISYACSEVAPGEIILQSDINLDRYAEEQLLKAYQKNANSQHSLGLIAGNQAIKVNNTQKTDRFYSYLPDGKYHKPDKILSVLAINDEGNTTLPPIYYRENNAPPQVINLTHRDYYKKVRNHQGWQLQLCPPAKKKTNSQCNEDLGFDNVYIQRLLNMSDGTRGTTISMPLYNDQAAHNSPKSASGYILAADVVLPSLSLARPGPYDFIYMVIDRNNGDVLFHSDESRTLVENLFYSGNNQSSLSEWIKMRLDHHGMADQEMIEGHYHGQAGRFKLVEAPVDAWAIVIFYPDDSLDVLMAQQFLFISISLAIVLPLLVFLGFLCRKISSIRLLKNNLSTPTTVNGRMIIMTCAILLCVIYSLYYIGLILNTNTPTFHPTSMSARLISIAGILILLFYLFVVRHKYFAAAGSDSRASTTNSYIVVFIVAILLSIIQPWYLHTIGQIPLKTLDFYHHQVYCNWVNYERQENIKMALGLYPNTITDYRKDPLKLLPLTDDSLESKLKKKDNFCQKHASQAEPGDYLSLSSQVDTTYLWQWISTFLPPGVGREQPSAPSSITQKDFSEVSRLTLDNVTVMQAFILILSISTIPLIIWLWTKFTRFMLWKRLYYSDCLLQHISRLVKLNSTLLRQRQPHTKLSIVYDHTKLNGIDMALLLGTAVKHENEPAASTQNNLLTGFDTLYRLSPCLQRLGANTHTLPNLKLNIEQRSDNKQLDVQIWDIEACLTQPEFRQNLLDLIMEIKSLTLANQLNSFTIYTGYYSLQRINMKDPLLMNNNSVLKLAEYLSWAECLMDFNVKITESFEHEIDKQLLKQEIADFPELSFLSRDTLDTPEATKTDLWNKSENGNIETQLTTIHYILLRAEAFYRFKWESCSNAEKLALLNLDKQHWLNPSNTHMIEHLAMKGLIKVEHGRLKIVNSSFAHFIRNAETEDTIRQLTSEGEAGFWKDYRLAIGLLMILIIGGIALISGEAITIVTASVVGIIGAIASIVKSAGMFTRQNKE